MAKSQLSVLQYLKGRVGSVSFFYREGELMGRTAHARPSNSTNVKLLTQRLRFGTLMAIATMLTSVLALGFPRRKAGRTPANMFMKRNMGTVTVDDLETGQVTVEFADLVVVEGRLVPPEVSVLREEGTNTLAFEVAPMTIATDCFADDKVYAVYVCPGKRTRVGSLELGTRGEGGSASVKIPSYMTGELFVYVFATTADGTLASDSVYLPLA